MLGLDRPALLRLATDDDGRQAAERLARRGAWRVCARSSRGVWGETVGRRVYAVRVSTEDGDARGPRTTCTCSARRRPCKHALALMLLALEDPDAVSAAPEPPEVARWLARRPRAAPAAAPPAATLADRAADDDGTTLDLGPRGSPAAASARARDKRLAARRARMSEGLDALERRLHDGLREGLARLERGGAEQLRADARRLVDAQVPGAASRLLRLAGQLGVASDWLERALVTWARLAIVIGALRRRDALPAPLVAELDALLGVAVTEAQLAAAPRVRDVWLVLAERVDEVEAQPLLYRRRWLLGLTQGRAATLVDFAPDARALAAPPGPGEAIDATLVFHPAAVAERARVVERHAVVGVDASVVGALAARALDVEGLLARHAERLAVSPLVERTPCILGPVVPGDVALEDDARGAWLVDHAGRAVPAEVEPTRLLAETGGHPSLVVGEWDGRRLEVLAISPLPRGAHAAHAAHASRRAASRPAPARAWPTVFPASLLAHAARGTRGDPILATSTYAPLDARVPPDLTPEARLLTLAAMTLGYVAAGRLAPVDLAPIAPADDADDRPLPPHVAPLLGEVLGGPLAALVPELVAGTRARGHVWPHALLPALLGVEDRALRAAIRPVLGARGAWLAARVEVGAWARPRDADAIVAALEVAGRAERLRSLAALRAVDRARFHAWLDVHVEGAAADERADWIELLGAALDGDDAPRLAACVDDRSGHVRQRAGALLLQLAYRLREAAPPAAVAARARHEARLRACLPGPERPRGSFAEFADRATRLLERGAARAGVGSGPAPRAILPLAVVLPDDELDGDWLDDGLTAKAPAGASPRAYLLEQLVARTPPPVLAALVGLGPDVLVPTLAASAHADVLLSGLRAAAVRFRDGFVADRLLDVLGPLGDDARTPERVGPLYALLDDAALAARAARCFAQGLEVEALAQAPAPWGPRLAAAFWAMGLKIPVGSAATVQGWRVFLEKAAWALPRESLRLPGTIPTPAARAPAAAWIRELVEVFVSTVRLRLRLLEVIDGS